MDYSEYNLPEDNEYIFILTLNISSMILEIDNYNRNSSLTNEQKRSRIREVRQQIMKTYGEIERERRRLLRQSLQDRGNQNIWLLKYTNIWITTTEPNNK